MQGQTVVQHALGLNKCLQCFWKTLQTPFEAHCNLAFHLASSSPSVAWHQSAVIALTRQT